MLRLVAICAVLGLVCGGFPKELLKRRVETASAERLMERLLENKRSGDLTCDKDPQCAEGVCIFKFRQQNLNLLGIVAYYRKDGKDELWVYLQSFYGSIYVQETKHDFDFSQLPYTSKSFETYRGQTYKIIVGDIDDSDEILHVKSMCLDKQYNR